VIWSREHLVWCFQGLRGCWPPRGTAETSVFRTATALWLRPSSEVHVEQLRGQTCTLLLNMSIWQIYIHTYIYIYIYKYMGTYIYIYTYKYIYKYIYTYGTKIYIYIWIYPPHPPPHSVKLWLWAYEFLSYGPKRWFDLWPLSTSSVGALRHVVKMEKSTEMKRFIRLQIDYHHHHHHLHHYHHHVSHTQTNTHTVW